MDLLAIGNHLLNLAAPACFVGWMLALIGSMLTPAGVPRAKTAGRLRRLWRAGWINTLVAGLASAAALVVFGRDGEMAGYGALTLAAASSQWVLMRSWR